MKGTLPKNALNTLVNSNTLVKFRGEKNIKNIFGILIACDSKKTTKK